MFQASRSSCVCLGALLVLNPIWAQQAQAPSAPLHLQIHAGTPLRLYLTRRALYRQGEPVQAKFAEPVWAFDRIVIPAGAEAHGQIVTLQPVSSLVRTMAIVRGDFTPLKRAQVQFTSFVLPDGQPMQVDAQPSLGLATIYVPPRPKKKSGHNGKTPPPPSGSRFSRLSSAAKQQAVNQANARTSGLLDFVRGPNKREWLEDFAWSKLPYRPQWYRSGTRFDAVLTQPLDFGTITVPQQNLDRLGNPPPPDTPANIRFLSSVDSKDAHPGDPVTAEISEPLYSASHQLLLPQGTLLTGKVTQARPARMFHRGGRLRFSFEREDLPPGMSAANRPAAPIRAQLAGAEPGTGNLKVDQEGTAQATESKTRFVRPVIAGLVAAKSMDNDAGKQHASGGADSNLSGRSLGGFSGFGLLGTAVAFGPKPLGSALGFYGLAWSVYSTVVSRGREVAFEKNSVMAIRFGTAPRNR